MAKAKKSGGKGGGRSAPESAGPPSATPNETGRTRKGEGGDAASVPKVGKHDSDGGDKEGGELH